MLQYSSCFQPITPPNLPRHVHCSKLARACSHIHSHHCMPATAAINFYRPTRLVVLFFLRLLNNRLALLLPIHLYCCPPYYLNSMCIWLHFSTDNLGSTCLPFDLPRQGRGTHATGIHNTGAHTTARLSFPLCVASFMAL